MLERTGEEDGDEEEDVENKKQRVRMVGRGKKKSLEKNKHWQ